MNFCFLRIALLAPALLALTVTSASAVIFTTKGADTRYEAAREMGSQYGKIGLVRLHYRWPDSNGQIVWQGQSAGTAFLVSPCHAITNAHVVPPRFADTEGGIHDFGRYEILMGPPTNGRLFRDRTDLRIVAKGQLYKKDIEEASAYQNRFVATAATGLSPELELHLSTYRDLSRTDDWALVELKECFGERYGFFEIDPTGASSIAGASTPIELAGYPIGSNGTIVSGNCSILGRTMFRKKISFDWSYSHDALLATDCTSRPGNSGGPVYYYDAQGVAKIIGVVATADVINSDIETDAGSLNIPREHADDYFRSWGRLAFSSGFVDIRQALLSPKVMATLKPYQPSLNVPGYSAALRDYQENAFHFHDSHSGEHLLASEWKDLPEGFLYLKLAKLNRQFGNNTDAARFEALAQERFEGDHWVSGIRPQRSYIDAATMIDNLSLLVDARDLFGLSRSEHFLHRMERLQWALRGKNLSIAREDLQAMKTMEADRPVYGDSPEEIHWYGASVNFLSGDYAAAVNDFEAIRAGSGCENCDLILYHLRALLLAYGNDQPKAVAAVLNGIVTDGPVVRFRLKGEEFSAPLQDFAIFYAFRNQRGIEPLYVEAGGTRKPYDASEHGDGGLDILLINHAIDAPHIAAEALQQKLRDNRAAHDRWTYYELDGVRYVATDDDYNLFWEFRFGMDIRELNFWFRSSAEFLAEEEYMHAAASADIEMTLNPDDLNAHLNRARALHAFGVLKDAIASYSDLIDRFATSSGVNAEFRGSVHYLRGSAFLLLGKISLARADFKRASDLVPANQTYRAKAQGR